MDRRESVKLLLIAAAGSPRLLRAQTPSSQEGFVSRWDSYPDMRWAGPWFWGNRLQDWEVRGGRVSCRTRAPNRTLHCLTHRPSSPDFTTTVLLDPVGLATPNGVAAFAGFRVGMKGRFEDYRSAAVHGTGLDVGVDANGALFVGEERGGRVDLGRPFVLQFQATPTVRGTDVELSAMGVDGGSLGTLARADLAPQDLVGNLALVSHYEDAAPAGPAAIFGNWEIKGNGLSVDQSSQLGPVMFAQYTTNRGVLKLTAQLAPVDDVEGTSAVLEAQQPNGSWEDLGTADIDLLSRTARFRIDDWDSGASVPYRVRVVGPSIPSEWSPYTGTIAAEPSHTGSLKAAVFSCNADHGFPDAEVVQNVLAQEPDLSLFLGDQFYESSGGFGIQTDSVEEAALDMLHKWYMFGWSYRDLFRHVPAAFIPDDHDVYHGNVWGEGGKAAPTDEGWGAVAQDQGGYKMPVEWVNAVQVAQTSHLPDPADPTPVSSGIGVYYTQWNYGGVSFAILEDRKFKSAPANVLPEDAQVLNGWIQNPAFDVREHRDLPEASLLGGRQMRFLEEWTEDWSGHAYAKVVLSQTNFAAVHTIPEDAMSGAVLPSLPMPEPGVYVNGDKLAVDMDSNGWPQARRDETLRILQRCGAFHIAGDQHLATVVRHGIDDFGDAGFTFTGPALNNIWPRRWWPPLDLKRRALEGRPEYCGDFFDGFGNRVTVHASANPQATGLEPSILRDRSTGYGIVSFDPGARSIQIDCWPRQTDPAGGSSGQYGDWPVTVPVHSDGRSQIGELPTVEVRGLDDPVVEVRNQAGHLVYSRRLLGNRFTPPVHERGPHTVRIGDPDRGVWQEQEVTEAEWGSGTLAFTFD
ncbi:MAG: alkaline phosphatase D family protein [Longimicrobiales bacterium]